MTEAVFLHAIGAFLVVPFLWFSVNALICFIGAWRERVHPTDSGRLAILLDALSPLPRLTLVGRALFWQGLRNWAFGFVTVICALAAILLAERYQATAAAPRPPADPTIVGIIAVTFVGAFAIAVAAIGFGLVCYLFSLRRTRPVYRTCASLGFRAGLFALAVAFAALSLMRQIRLMQ